MLAKQTLLVVVAVVTSFGLEGLKHGVHAKSSGSQGSLCDGNSESRVPFPSVSQARSLCSTSLYVAGPPSCRLSARGCGVAAFKTQLSRSAQAPPGGALASTVQGREVEAMWRNRIVKMDVALMPRYQADLGAADDFNARAVCGRQGQLSAADLADNSDKQSAIPSRPAGTERGGTALSQN